MGSAASIVDSSTEATKITIPTLKGLQDAIDTACFQFEKWPLVMDDKDGNAERFLKYSGRVLSTLSATDVDPENLRRVFLECLKSGSTMTISFGDNVPDLSVLEDKECFPSCLASRSCCFDESIWSKLLRPGVDPPLEKFRFEIKGTMTIVLVTRSHDVPSNFMENRFTLVDIGTSVMDGEKEDVVASLFGVPLREKKRNSTEMAEAAFDGDIDEVIRLLNEGFHIDSCDEDGHSCLSEAAAKGHRELVTCLLERGADPNYEDENSDGKSALFRAAFNGHLETCRALLEAGADPDKAWYVCCNRSSKQSHDTPLFPPRSSHRTFSKQSQDRRISRRRIERGSCC